MIALRDFLARVAAIEDEHPTYRKGGYGRDGTCDCIGLIIGAIRRAGGVWTGTHGSNYAARYAVDEMHVVGRASDLQVGDAVFKARRPGDSGYDLPPAYANHYDQRDYYHVGVVLSVVPLVIIHSTSPDTTVEAVVDGVRKKVPTSIRRDNKLGAWAYAGRLRQIDYERRDEEMSGTMPYAARVTISSGHLNVRSAPGTAAPAVGRLYAGDVVQVVELVALTTYPPTTWARIGEARWVSEAYLTRVTDQEVDGTRQTDQEGMVFIPETLARQLYAMLGEALGVTSVD